MRGLSEKLKDAREYAATARLVFDRHWVESKG